MSEAEPRETADGGVIMLGSPPTELLDPLAIGIVERKADHDPLDFRRVVAIEGRHRSLSAHRLGDFEAQLCWHLTSLVAQPTLSGSLGVMVRWEVTVFDSRTEDRLARLPVGELDMATVRRTWNLRKFGTVGELPITDKELAFVNPHLATPLDLRPGQVAFLAAVQEFDNEVVEEPDGTRWYPPP